MSELQKTQTKAVAVNATQQLFDNINSKITSIITDGGIALPKDYNASNAMRSAWLMLQDIKDRNGKPALEVCTPASIANSLMKMVVQGMNPAKAQCYFIPYGDQLNYQRSYMGSYALAKRVSTLKEVNAVIIYEGDIFSYEIDNHTGRTTVKEHTQKFENINNDKINGGYAICVFEDGSVDTVIMTMAQIRKSWEQGQTKGQSPAHKNFADEMAKKSIRARAVKLIINSSDDSDIMQEDDQIKDHVELSSKAQIALNANTKTIPLDDPKKEEEEEITHDVPHSQGEESSQTEGPQKAMF